MAPDAARFYCFEFCRWKRRPSVCSIPQSAGVPSTVIWATQIELPFPGKQRSTLALFGLRSAISLERQRTWRPSVAAAVPMPQPARVSSDVALAAAGTATHLLHGYVLADASTRSCAGRSVTAVKSADSACAASERSKAAGGDTCSTASETRCDDAARPRSVAKDTQAQGTAPRPPPESTHQAGR